MAFKSFIFLPFLIFFIFLKCLVFAGNVTIQGPSETTFWDGDKILITCATTEESGGSQLHWAYVYADGNTSEVYEHIDTLEDSFKKPGARTTVIRLDSRETKLRSIRCTDYDGDMAEFPVKFVSQGAKPVPWEKTNLCENINEDIEIIMERDDDMLQSRYFQLHSIKDGAELSFDDSVSSLKFTCVSNDTVEWSLRNTNLKKLRYWKVSPQNGKSCHLAMIRFYPSDLANGEIATLSCNNANKSIKSEITVANLAGTTRQNNNETETCINAIFEQFENGSSGRTGWGVGIGSSAMSLGMVVAIVYMKRRLNQQERQISNA